MLEKIHGSKTSTWTVQHEIQRRGKVNPGKTQHLLMAIGEERPFEALSDVKKHIKEDFDPNRAFRKGVAFLKVNSDE